MSFGLSGSVITQTGTDTSLAGIGAISGVTTVENNSSPAYTCYDIAALQLVIEGTLTIDPEIESLIQNDAASFPCVQVASGGTLNIGKKVTLNSFDRYTQGLAMHLGNDQSDWSQDDSSFQVADGGTLNWYSGTISLRGAVGFIAGSTVLIDSQYAVLVAHAVASSAAWPQIRQVTTALTINGFTLDRAIITMLANPTKMSGIEAIHSAEVFGASGSSPTATFMLISDFVSGGGNTLEFGFWSDKWFRASNNSAGTDCIIGGHHPSNASNRGLCEIRETLNVLCSDVDSVALTGYGWYTKDRDWGNRLAASQISTNPDYTADREYAVVESGGDATYDTDGGILIGMCWRDTGGDRFSADNEWDYRGEQNSDSDLFIVRVRKYGYLFTTATLPLKGIGGVETKITLFADSNVTQAAGTAAAHTGITITDHGASPVSWQSKSWGITITCNTSTNPSLTAEDVFHYLQYHLALTSTTFNSKLGGAWHNMVKAVSGSYETENGTYGGDRTVKGVRIVDQSGDPFGGIKRMQADDGTYYTPPVTVPVKVTVKDVSTLALIQGARVLLETGSGGPASAGVTIINALTDINGEVNTTYNYVGDQPVVGRVRKGTP